MNKKEYIEFENEQKNKLVKSKVFKHKITGEYETQISIMELHNYYEVKELDKMEK